MGEVDAPRGRGRADDARPAKRVAYLLGAGATQGCASYRGSQHTIVMPGLAPQLRSSMRQLVYERYENVPSLLTLVNDVIDDGTDFEHLITFLEDSPSRRHREFAAELKMIFSSVLRLRLDEVRVELGDSHSLLYAALVDMHFIGDSPEHLNGILTLNYDLFLEHAIETHLRGVVDYGLAVRPAGPDASAIRVLKLHGSFGWSDTWPVAATAAYSSGLWIPPGIRKAKSEYPFNAIWGKAREVLNCDVLRIVGCNLGQNDWDLVSLLFTTMHSHVDGRSYDIEVISWPHDADRIAAAFPYLNVKSILAIDRVGASVVAEVLGGSPVEFEELETSDQRTVLENVRRKIANPFAFWLTLKAETLNEDVASIDSTSGVFRQFLAST